MCSSECLKHFAGDHSCDEQCDTEECDWDGLDCHVAVAAPGDHGGDGDGDKKPITADGGILPRPVVHPPSAAFENVGASGEGSCSNEEYTVFPASSYKILYDTDMEKCAFECLNRFQEPFICWSFEHHVDTDKCVLHSMKATKTLSVANTKVICMRYPDGEDADDTVTGQST